MARKRKNRGPDPAQQVENQISNMTHGPLQVIPDKKQTDHIGDQMRGAKMKKHTVKQAQILPATHQNRRREGRPVFNHKLYILGRTDDFQHDKHHNIDDHQRCIDIRFRPFSVTVIRSHSISFPSMAVQAIIQSKNFFCHPDTGEAELSVSPKIPLLYDSCHLIFDLFCF